jgi:hypothetical protein
MYLNGEIKILNESQVGSLRGTVPYTLSGQTVTFSVPSDVLNVGNSFNFRLELYEYGAWRLPVYFATAGGPIPVPEPGAVQLFAMGALFCVFLLRNRRAR